MRQSSCGKLQAEKRSIVNEILTNYISIRSRRKLGDWIGIIVSGPLRPATRAQNLFYQ